MKNKFFRLKSFIAYWLSAVDEHSLHSPFFFDLYTKTLQAKDVTIDLTQIEELRIGLLRDDRTIEVTDYGSGSAHFRSSKRKISDIARTSLSPQKYSLLYLSIIHRLNCKNLLELGTSLGINALYLSTVKESNVITFEGSNAIAAVAQSLFDTFSATNITLITGNIDHTLPSQISSIANIDFAFLDAHHRYRPTLQYFNSLMQKIHERSVVVLDDIHHSPEMEKAWKEIKAHERVHATADLYRCGIVFFDPSLNKQHVVLQF